jgi:hypothetical protein
MKMFTAEVTRRCSPKILLLGAVALAGLSMLGPVAQAATWTGGGTPDNNWTNAANWGGALPIAGEDVTIGAGYTVDVTTDLGVTIAKLNLGNATTTLNIHSNGVLSANGNSSEWTKGTVDIQGVFNWGPAATYTGGGSISVSGNGQLATVTHAFITPSGAALTISLTGSSASIGTLGQLGDFGGAGGTTSFVLSPGATGINPIDVTWDLWLGSGSNTLTVNIDDYMGARTVVLFTYGTLTDNFETVNITRTGGGNLSLGSDPSGDPNNLGQNEYYLDYGATAITLYYKVYCGTVISIH